MTLTNEEIFIQYKNEGNQYKKEQLANELFARNEKFIHHISKKFRGSKIPYDEVVNLATIGMVKSLKTYNPETSKFLTYSSRLMTNEILMELRKSEYKKNTISIDTPVADGLTIGDAIKDESTPFEDIVERKDYAKMILDVSSKKMSERDIVIFNNMICDEPKNQKDIASELNVSQSYVSRLEKKIINKVRSLLLVAETV